MKQNNGVALTGNQQIMVKQTENLIINILQTQTDVSTPSGSSSIYMKRTHEYSGKRPSPPQTKSNLFTYDIDVKVSLFYRKGAVGANCCIRPLHMHTPVAITSRFYNVIVKHICVLNVPITTCTVLLFYFCAKLCSDLMRCLHVYYFVFFNTIVLFFLMCIDVFI